MTRNEQDRRIAEVEEWTIGDLAVHIVLLETELAELKDGRRCILPQTFTADREGKIRTRLIKLGWMPPEVAAELKAAFRVNMLQRARPGEDIATEIDRVLSQFNPVP